MPHQRWILLIALLLIGTNDAVSQRRTSSRRAAASQTKARSMRVKSLDQFYWSAQGSIAAAIQQLQSYLNAHPGGEYAATARQQLKVLHGLSLAASRSVWASMDSRPQINSAPQWRITSVEREPQRTSVTIEIRCPREDGGECLFDPFDRAPLVLVDNVGRIYPMLEAGALLRDVRITGQERAEVAPGQAVLSGARSITVKIEFAPLAGGVVSVQMYYREDNHAEPARFTLLGHH